MSRRETPRAGGSLRQGLLFGTAAVLLLAAVGLAVIAVSAQPPRGGLKTPAGPKPASSALPGPGDLTLGGEAGEVLVGVTLRPAQPGLNQVLVFVLPLEGREDAAGLPVSVSVGTRTVTTGACGPTCRRTHMELQGGERLTVTVGGKIGGSDVLRVPSLPAPDATGVFMRMQERMHGLQSYRVEETLNSGRVTVRAEYGFQAPDRMHISVAGGVTRVIVGNRDWTRERPGAPWEEDSAVEPRVPSFIWDSGDPVALRIMGREEVDGVPTTVISFLGGGGIPIWYRLWIDDTGLVRRAEMRAQGHFMDHRYLAFDAPLHIRPPLASSEED
jgi:hypothetical protein